MKHLHIHDKIIERAKVRPKPSMSERHHIWPKFLGGSNLKENMVYLTLREHYLVHKLLAKIFEGVYPEIFLIFVSMKRFCKGVYSGRSYEKHKSLAHQKIRDYQKKPGVTENKIKIRTGAKHSEETKDYISSVNLGRVHSQEFRNRTSERFKGVRKSPEHRKKISDSQLGCKNHMYGTLPWDNPSAIKYNTVKFWVYAGTFYDWWVANGSVMNSNQSVRMMRLTNITCPNGVAISCIRKFQSGWIPYNDKDWLEFVRGNT